MEVPYSSMRHLSWPDWYGPETSTTLSRHRATLNPNIRDAFESPAYPLTRKANWHQCYWRSQHWPATIEMEPQSWKHKSLIRLKWCSEDIWRNLKKFYKSYWEYLTKLQGDSFFSLFQWKWTSCHRKATAHSHQCPHWKGLCRLFSHLKTHFKSTTGGPSHSTTFFKVITDDNGVKHCYIYCCITTANDHQQKVLSADPLFPKRPPQWMYPHVDLPHVFALPDATLTIYSGLGEALGLQQSETQLGWVCLYPSE